VGRGYRFHPILLPITDLHTSARLSYDLSYFFLLSLRLKRRTAIYAIPRTTVEATLSHIGLSTHHHDHLITLHSFNTMKASVNNEVNEIPFEMLDFSFSIIQYLIS
jgi:hypothetical protein